MIDKTGTLNVNRLEPQIIERYSGETGPKYMP